MGMPANNIFVGAIGDTLELTQKKAAWNGSVPSGVLLVDGNGVGDVGNIVLRDRKHLAEDGIIIVTAVVDRDFGIIVGGPEVVSRGFVYVRENEELIDSLRRIAATSIEKQLGRRSCDWAQIKKAVSDDISRFVYNETRRRPMILPIILDAE